MADTPDAFRLWLVEQPAVRKQAGGLISAMALAWPDPVPWGALKRECLLMATDENRAWGVGCLLQALREHTGAPALQVSPRLSTSDYSVRGWNVYPNTEAHDCFWIEGPTEGEALIAAWRAVWDEAKKEAEEWQERAEECCTCCSSCSTNPCGGAMASLDCVGWACSCDDDAWNNGEGIPIGIPDHNPAPRGHGEQMDYENTTEYLFQELRMDADHPIVVATAKLESAIHVELVRLGVKQDEIPTSRSRELIGVIAAGAIKALRKPEWWLAG